jgi:branched-chain amino acid transport system permease protein
MSWLVNHLRVSWAWWIYAILIVIALALPKLVEGSYLYVASLFLIMTLFATSLNLLLGYAGLLSFGQSAFLGVGGYTLALLMAKASIPFIPALIAAPVIAAIFALIIGFFCVRLTGVYFAILALAFSQIIFYSISQWYVFTGGDDGMPVAIPQYIIDYYYYFTLGVVSICLLVLYKIVSSPFGRIIQAMRDDPERATFMGVDVRKTRLVTFMISGAFAGVAGALLVTHQRMAFPEIAGFAKGFEPILMVLLGGTYNFFGPMVGAGLFVFLEFLLSSYTEYSSFFFGILVLVVVMVLPGGVVGFIQERLGRLKKAS